MAAATHDHSDARLSARRPRQEKVRHPAARALLSLPYLSLSGRSIYKATDVQNLKCTVYFVDRETIVQTKSIEDWDVGKHGIYVQFADPRTGKQFTKAYLPEAIVKRGAGE